MTRLDPVPFPELPSPEEVHAGGVTLAVRKLGEGPRMLLLHGGPGLDHHLLLPLSAPLAKHYEVWLPDLPGHGLSHEEWKRPPGLFQMRDRLAKWVAALPHRPDVLCGHSLGAWLARELIRKGRIEPCATVLISPPAAGRTGKNSSVRLRVQAASDYRLPPLPADEDTMAREEFLCFVQQETGGAIDDDFLEAIFLTRFRSPLDYSSLLQQLHRTLMKPTPPCDAGPVLVLCGDSDRTTPPRQAEAVAEATRNSRLVILENAGHFPFAGGSPIAAREIVSFLDELL